jgi:hypothetical protein
MAIAILLQDAFDIETYDGLVAYIIAHLELDSESQAQVPTFIRKGEYRLNRLVTAPERETSAALTTTAGEQAVALPVDYRQLRTAQFVADDGYPLEPVTLNVLHSQYSGSSGRPQAYAISEQSVQFGPMPDGEYTVNLTYMAKIPALSSTNQTNWLLSTNADAYVYSTLWQAAAWLEDLDAAIAFRSELMAIIDELNLSGNRYRNASPMRLRSPGVIV